MLDDNINIINIVKFCYETEIVLILCIVLFITFVSYFRYENWSDVIVDEVSFYFIKEANVCKCTFTIYILFKNKLFSFMIHLYEKDINFLNEKQNLFYYHSILII